MDEKQQRRGGSGTRGVSGHWTYRFGTHPLQDWNGSHVTSQAHVRDGVDGNQVVQAVVVRIERRIQLLAECVIHVIRPVCSAQIELHSGSNSFPVLSGEHCPHEFQTTTGPLPKSHKLVTVP
jgi:hypothetical protein